MAEELVNFTQKRISATIDAENQSPDPPTTAVTHVPAQQQNFPLKQRFKSTEGLEKMIIAPNKSYLE